MKNLQNAVIITGALFFSLTYAIPLLEAEKAIDAVSNSYIVVFEDSVPTAVVNKHNAWLKATNEYLGESEFTGQGFKYNIGGFKGYSGEFNDLTIKKIRARPEVAFVEKNGVVRVSDCVNQTIEPYQGEWGLGTISHRIVRPSPWTEFIYNSNRSECKTRPSAYVIDSGIRVTHDEFEGRAEFIFKANSEWGETDSCGHGTHVAGKIAGKTYGVEKTSKLYAVKVLDGRKCTGTFSGIIAGMEFAFKHAGAVGRSRSNSVINMSLGGPPSLSIDLAVQNIVARGLTVVVAAGNLAGDACAHSPASAPSAITVGATNIYNHVAEFSNIGCCVDIFAPGEGVKSSTSESDSSAGIYSGTSMASPHVAGIILHNKCLYGFSTPEQDRNQLFYTSTNGTIRGNRCVKGCCASNSLVFNGGCSLRIGGF